MFPSPTGVRKSHLNRRFGMSCLKNSPFEKASSDCFRKAMCFPCSGQAAKRTAEHARSPYQFNLCLSVPNGGQVRLLKGK